MVNSTQEEIGAVIMAGLAEKDFRMKTVGSRLHINFGDYAYQFDTPIGFPERIIKALEQPDNNNDKDIVFRLDPAAQDG